MNQDGRILRSIYLFFVKNEVNKSKRVRMGRIILNIYAFVVLSFWFFVLAFIAYLVISNFEALTATLIVLSLGVFAVFNILDFEKVQEEFRDLLEEELKSETTKIKNITKVSGGSIKVDEN